MAVDATAWLGFAPVRRRGKTARRARALTMTAAADLIRATVNNRVDNGVPDASVAIHCRRR